MSDADLRSLLAQLHERLQQGAAPSDPETRAALVQIVADVDRVLGGADPHASLGERMRDAATRLETEHPELAAIAGRVMDALGRAGI